MGTEAVYWLTADQQQVGPEPLSTVLDRVRGGQIPPTTSVWWEGAAGWAALSSLPEGAGLSQPAGPSDAIATATPSSPVAPGAGDLLMAGLSDQELDDEFMTLLKRSWELYKVAEFATSIDEAMLGGIVTALVDCGFVLIDVETAGGLPLAAPPPTTSGVSVETAPVLPVAVHNLRFEAPDNGSRVTVAMDHLTPDAGSAKLLGQLASVQIGYGQRVPNFQQVSGALRQEIASAFVASPEPGTVSWDADIASSYVYAQIDLFLELERYVADDFAVDHELLRRHLAAVVHTLRTFVHARFGA